MATFPEERMSMSAEHRFFFRAAIAMAVTIVLGFSTQLAMGRSSFGAPFMVHVHAVVFFGWTAFYVLQTALIAKGSVALHKRLGWFGAGWASLIVLLGIYTTIVMVQRGRTPFFFEPNYFLFMNSMTILGFGGLTAAAIVLRRRTDWHRRLLFCGMAILTGPAFGRLLPLPLLIPWAGWAVFIAVMVFPLIGIFRDIQRSGSIHHAWYWGAGTITVIQLTIGIIAFSQPGLAIYNAVTKGSAGEMVAPLAFPPFPTAQ